MLRAFESLQDYVSDLVFIGSNLYDPTDVLL